jgi:hypothetical protein
LRKNSAGANMMYSQAEHVFILEHYFTTKLFDAICESLGNAFGEKKVTNRAKIYNTSEHKVFVTSVRRATKRL